MIKNVLKLTMVMVAQPLRLGTTELHTLNEYTVWYVRVQMIPRFF